MKGLTEKHLKMNVKTTLLISLAMGTIQFSSAQLTQTGNSYEKLNSATAGLLFKHEANLTLSTQGGSNFIRSSGVANFSTLSKNGKYGFGINHWHQIFRSDFYQFDYNALKFNVNRQFVLRDSSRLSIGLGLGGGYQSLQAENLISSRGGNFLSDLSVAYASEKWKAGVSFMSSVYDSGVDFNATVFGSYTFGNREKLQFTPHLFLGASNFNVGGTFAYKSKFFLGGGVKKFTGWTPYATAGIRLANRFQINYSIDFLPQPLPSGVPIIRHELGISFQLGKR